MVDVSKYTPGTVDWLNQLTRENKGPLTREQIRSAMQSDVARLQSGKNLTGASTIRANLNKGVKGATGNLRATGANANAIRANALNSVYPNQIGNPSQQISQAVNGANQAGFASRVAPELSALGNQIGQGAQKLLNTPGTLGTLGRLAGSAGSYGIAGTALANAFGDQPGTTPLDRIVDTIGGIAYGVGGTGIAKKDPRLAIAGNAIGGITSAIPKGYQKQARLEQEQQQALEEELRAHQKAEQEQLRAEELQARQQELAVPSVYEQYTNATNQVPDTLVGPEDATTRLIQQLTGGQGNVSLPASYSANPQIPNLPPRLQQEQSGMTYPQQIQQYLDSPQEGINTTYDGRIATPVLQQRQQPQDSISPYEILNAVSNIQNQYQGSQQPVNNLGGLLGGASNLSMSNAETISPGERTRIENLQSLYNQYTPDQLLDVARSSEKDALRRRSLDAWAGTPGVASGVRSEYELLNDLIKFQQDALQAETGIYNLQQQRDDINQIAQQFGLPRSLANQAFSPTGLQYLIGPGIKEGVDTRARIPDALVDIAKTYAKAGANVEEAQGKLPIDIARTDNEQSWKQRIATEKNNIDLRIQQLKNDDSEQGRKLKALLQDSQNKTAIAQATILGGPRLANAVATALLNAPTKTDQTQLLEAFKNILRQNGLDLQFDLD